MNADEATRSKSEAQMQPKQPDLLARRLRELRKAAGITQEELALALGVSVPLVSSWESLKKPVLPPEHRLAQCAAVLSAAELPAQGRWRGFAARAEPQDEAARQRLQAELFLLRATAIGKPAATAPEAQLEEGAIGTGPWHFPDGGEVVIVCAEFDPEMRANLRYADPADPDYVAAYNYADLDSLIELFGHIRASNPASQVRFRLAPELTEDDYTAHLALLGGVDWNAGTRNLLSRLDLPVRQVGFVDNPNDVAGFDVPDGKAMTRYTPVLRGDQLMEDVAQFVRGPNPFNVERTFTICNGMYGRGTLGAVRALTDAPIRGRNATYVRESFASDSAFSLLFRVVIFEGKVLTPDWTQSDTLLHAWSEVE